MEKARKASKDQQKHAIHAFRTILNHERLAERGIHVHVHYDEDKDEHEISVAFDWSSNGLPLFNVESVERDGMQRGLSKEQMKQITDRAFDAYQRELAKAILF